jgi:hypothetical protein
MIKMALEKGHINETIAKKMEKGSNMAFGGPCVAQVFFFEFLNFFQVGKTFLFKIFELQQTNDGSSIRHEGTFNKTINVGRSSNFFIFLFFRHFCSLALLMELILIPWKVLMRED